MFKEKSRGYSLLELLFVLAILSLAVTLTCNSLIRLSRRIALRTAAISLSRLLEKVQYDAYGSDHMRGVRFSQTAEGWQVAVYEDGDGDGVLNADINSGVDLLIEGPIPIIDRLSMVRIGVPAPRVLQPDGGGPFPPSARPVNFNQSSICSFAPNGDATPGSVYLVSGNTSEAAMVRSSGDGGRIRVLFFGVEGKKWSS
jgi:prepilin-type N-terminal cleavage/methylation domain-containing protein